MTTEEKESLIASLDEARARLKAILNRIDTETDIYPHWKLKQFLDHIAGWDDAVLVALRSHVCGDVPEVVAPYGIDYYNEQTVTFREALPMERTLSEFEQTRELIRKLVREMPEDVFHKDMVAPWGGIGSIREIIEVFVQHEHEHAQEIEEHFKELTGK